MKQAELVIVGGGPAGLAAGIQARELGVDALLFDENPTPGGQIYRQPPPEFIVTRPDELGPTFARGSALLAKAEKAGVVCRTGTVVWDLDGTLKLETASAAGPEVFQAKRVILAAGAYDRPVPVPGWTLPGVYTVGGAQNLLKSLSLVVGRRVLAAGTGPLLLLVASQLAAAGAQVVAADPVRPRRALGKLPALLSEWRLLRDAASYHWKLLRHRAKWLSPFVITSIEGGDRVERATVARADRSWRPVPGTEETLEVDAVALGYGLMPSIELVRLAGCEVRFDDTSGTWLPVRDDEFTTTVPGLAVAGDGGGVAGAAVAELEGRIAAIAAARDLGHIDDDTARTLQRGSLKRLRSLNRFQVAIADVYAPGPGLHDLATPETIVCRCEEVTRGEVEEAFAFAPAQLELLKLWTRVTMGPCQGRLCLPFLLARTAAEREVPPGSVPPPRPRFPSKPLPLAWVESSADPDAPRGRAITEAEPRGRRQ